MRAVVIEAKTSEELNDKINELLKEKEIVELSCYSHDSNCVAQIICTEKQMDLM